MQPFHALYAPLHAQIVQWQVQPGQRVARGDVLLIVEAMKMEHEIRAEASGVLGTHFFVAGESVKEGELLSNIELSAQHSRGLEAENTINPGWNAAAQERADLARLRERLAFTQDAARMDAVAKRHALGQRTARENIAALVDPGSFVEYGALAVAAQRSRRSEADLIANTPADGMVCGIGSCARPTYRGHGLRRHRAGRHPGHAQPPEDRPHAGPGTAAQAARGVVG